MSRKYSRKAGRVVRYTRADGTAVEKHYPPYRGKQRAQDRDTIGALIEAFERSPEYQRLARTTRRGYDTYLRDLTGLERVAVKAITRRELMEARDAIAQARGDGAAAGFSRAVSTLFGWAVDRGWIDHTPAGRMRKGLASGHLPAWSEGDVRAALGGLPEHLRRAVVLALYTGQRRGDLITMPWSAYDGSTIRLVQGKTSQALVIPAPAELRAELDAWRQQAGSTMILVNKFGRPWLNGSNLSKQLGGALAAIPGIPAGRNIHGLRKLAATRLAEAGCTPHEIASITGHRTLAMVALYTRSVDQERAAEAAVVKLSEHRHKR